MSFITLTTTDKKIISILDISKALFFTASEITFKDLYPNEIEYMKNILSHENMTINSFPFEELGIYKLEMGYDLNVRILFGYIIIQKNPAILDVILKELEMRKKEFGEIDIQKFVKNIFERRVIQRIYTKIALNGKYCPITF